MRGRINLDRKRIWGWWFFDWASQPYHTLIVSFIFSTYYAEIARTAYVTQGSDPAQAGVSAQSLWGYGLAASGIIIAVLAPILGAVADVSRQRLPWIWFFSGLIIVGAAGTWWLTPDNPRLIQTISFFGLGLVGVELATIFTNSMLSGIAPRSQVGHISGSGFAFGYLGGLVALALMLVFFAEGDNGKTIIGIEPVFGLDPAGREGTRFVGPFTALWYMIFIIPFFLWVKETDTAKQSLSLRTAMSNLGQLISDLPRRKSLLRWLLSSMLSRDALNALYGFGGVYAGTVLGWPVMLSGVFGIISIIFAALISWLSGKADSHWGPKPVVACAIIVLALVCVIIISMDRTQLLGLSLAEESKLPDIVFFICGALIGGAGGAMQAAARTLTVHHTSDAHTTEIFGLYALSGKATAFLAPFLIARVTEISGSQRIGISPLIVMFILAILLLKGVNKNGEAEQ